MTVCQSVCPSVRSLSWNVPICSVHGCGIFSVQLSLLCLLSRILRMAKGPYATCRVVMLYLLAISSIFIVLLFCQHFVRPYENKFKWFIYEHLIYLIFNVYALFSSFSSFFIACYSPFYYRLYLYVCIFVCEILYCICALCVVFGMHSCGWYAAHCALNFIIPCRLKLSK